MIYKVSKKEKAVVIMMIFMAIIIISILFYGTIYAVVILLPLGVPIYREQKRRIINKKKKELQKNIKIFQKKLKIVLTTDKRCAKIDIVVTQEEQQKKYIEK